MTFRISLTYANGYRRISGALKLVGYSWTLPAGLVERLDACVDAQHAFGDTQQQQAYADFGDDAMLMDMFPTPLDSNFMGTDGNWPWMAMFTMPTGTVHGQGH